MTNLAWVISASTRDLIASERELVASMRNLGLKVSPVVWDEENDWGKFSAVIIRTTWDYHLKIDRFKLWLENLDRIEIPVFNPTEIVRWNLHKFYLEGLSQNGVPIVPTIFNRQGQNINFEQLFDDGWNDVIVKPAISATAHKLFKVNGRNHHLVKAAIEDMVRGHDLLVQKFQPEVALKGEWSLIFFNSQFSHAVLKMPGEGDFRVQNDFGGSSKLADPGNDLIDQVKAIINRLDSGLLYARIDGIVVGKQFLLMELELIEPDLFLLTSEIRDNFIRALRQKLSVS